MNKIIPILPCPSLKEQIAFYEQLGFELVEMTNRPNPYAAVAYGSLEIHFYGSKKTVPGANASMCYIRVDDVNRMYEELTSSLKETAGNIPRSGIPRISKLKDLSDDRRFIITDVGGNTLFVGTPNAQLADPPFYRTIESAEYARPFETLYDLLYSKEDIRSAYTMLTKHFPDNICTLSVPELDLAKILLVTLDLHLQRGQTADPSINDKLKELLDSCDRSHPDWIRIAQKYSDILNVET